MSSRITTVAGQEMFRSVTPVYNVGDLDVSIFEANGQAMDDVRAIIENLKIEMYPQNATWTLEYWEQLLGIKVNKNLSDSNRVQKVLYELNKYFTVTKYRMEQIVNTFVENKNAFIEDVDGEYAFLIVIPVDTKILKGLRESVEDTKPAHLLAIYERVIESGAIVIANNTYHYPVFYPYEPYGEKQLSMIDSENIGVVDDTYTYVIDYMVSEKFSSVIVGSVRCIENSYNYRKRFIEAGNLLPLDKTVSTQTSSVLTGQETYDYKKIFAVCGEFVAGE